MPNTQPLPLAPAIQLPLDRIQPQCRQKSSGHLRELLETVDELRQLRPQPSIPLCRLPLPPSQGACTFKRSAGGAGRAEQ